METNELDKDYTRIKKSLEQMGYKNQFGSESLGLITRLLNDIIKAGEACKKFKSEREKLASDLRVQGDITLPLRNENIKLTKENNDLHKEIIEIKDALEVRHNQNSSAMAKLEADNAELKFVLTQKDTKIQTLESQAEALKRKLNDIFSKLYMGEATRSKLNPGQGIPNASKIINKDTPMNTLGKKNSFHLSTNLLGVEITNGTPIEKFQEELMQVNLSKEAWAKDLQLSDVRAEKLQNEIKALREELNSKVDIIKSMKKGLSSRDMEIQRMQVANYIGDDNKEELKLKYQSDTIAIQNEKLNQQINFLNTENHRLHQIDYMHNHRCREEEIKRLDEIIVKLTKENETLKKNKSNVVVTQNNNDTSKTGMQSMMMGPDVSNTSMFGLNSRNVSVLQSMKKNSNRLENELKYTKDNLHTVSKSLLAVKEDLNKNILSFNTERASYVKRIETLMNEVNTLKAEKEKKSKEASSSIEQADDFKNELNLFKANDMIKSKLFKEKEDYINEIIDDYSKIKNEAKLLKTKIAILEKENEELNTQNATTKILQAQIEQKDQEIVKLKTNQSPTKNAKFQSFGQNDIPQIDAMNYQNKIEKLEKELNETKESNKLLEADKLSLSEQINKTRQELLELTKEIKDNSILKEELTEIKEKENTMSTHIIKLKNENEKLKTDLSTNDFELKKKDIEHSKINEAIHQLKLDNAQLKTEKTALKASNEQYQNEMNQYQQRESTLISQTSEVSDLKVKIAKSTGTITQLQTELNLSKQTITLLKKETESLNNKLLQMNSTINDGDSTREELLTKLQAESFRAKTLETELKALYDTQMKLNEHNNHLLKDNNDLQQSLKTLDSHCIHLTNDLDKKTELIAKLEIEHQNKTSLLDDMNNKLKNNMSKSSLDMNRLNDREVQLKEAKVQISLYDNDINQLRGMLAERNKEIQDIGNDNVQLKNKNDKLLEDIKRFAKENERLEIIKTQLEQNTDFFKTKNVSNEYDIGELAKNLKSATKDKDKLKRNIQLFVDENREAAKHIQSIEEQLAQYDESNRKLMNDKDALIAQIETVDKYNSDLTEEVHRLKDEMSHMKQSYNNYMKQNQMDKDINRKYEEYIASLNSKLAQKENDIKFLQNKIEELAVKSEMNSQERESYEKNLRNYEEIINEERRRNINTMQALHQKEIASVNSSDEDNLYLKKLINDLHYQIDGLNSELQGLKNENYQLKSMKQPLTYEMSGNSVEDRPNMSQSQSNQLGMSSEQE